MLRIQRGEAFEFRNYPILMDSGSFFNTLYCNLTRTENHEAQQLTCGLTINLRTVKSIQNVRKIDNKT